jgi:hypothetical protein
MSGSKDTGIGPFGGVFSALPYPFPPLVVSANSFRPTSTSRRQSSFRRSGGGSFLAIHLVPFFLAGVLIGLALMRGKDNVHTVYGSNLAGSTLLHRRPSLEPR